jgi:nucleoside-diphosphate-sugar epimerase
VPGPLSRGPATLITGGFGLVGASLTRHLLETDPGRRVVVLDRAEPDAAAVAYLDGHGDRLQAVLGDIADPSVLERVDGEGVDRVVHAAMVAHVPEWERERPRSYIDVNVSGTANVLEWARTLPGLARVLYVSTGGVYGEQTSCSSESPQSEDGPLDPPELYPITKLASELIVRRYGELFGFDVRIARLSGVFGPLERPTPSRRLMSPVHTLLHGALAGRPVRVTARTLDSAGDHISAEDVADGLARLLAEPAPAHTTYNLAHGERTGFRELLAAFEAAGEPVAVELADAAEAELDLDPANRRARWNAYDIERARRDLGWSPRPLAEQLARSAGWLRASGRA